MEQELLVQKILKTLRDNHVDFVVVGGYAWEHNVMPVGTIDLDIMILSRDYDDMLNQMPLMLRQKNIFAELVQRDPIMSLIRTSYGGMSVELELINSKYYSTSNKDFLVYTKQYRSNLANGIYYAKPELIWYMRLYLPDWEVYIIKCLRELVLAYQYRRFRIKLSDIIEISEVFGTQQMIKPRVKVLMKYLRIRRFR